MKLIGYLFFAMTLALGVLGVELQKQVVVYYPDETPDSVVNDAKDAIRQAGGVITHEFNLIKAFAATAGEKVIESVQAMGSAYQALVEEDQVVSVA